MKTRHSQSGFGHVAVVFLILFVAVAGFAGYKVVTMNKSQKDDVTAVVPQAQLNAAAPARINSKADLVQTAKALDNSSASVDNSLDDNGLNQDLNDML